MHQTKPARRFNNPPNSDRFVSFPSGPFVETKTKPKPDHPVENQKPFGNSNATYEGNIKGAVSPPKPDHPADAPPPPPKSNDPAYLQRYHAAKHEYRVQRNYQKLLQSLSPEDLFRECEIGVAQKEAVNAERQKHPETQPPQPPIQNTQPPSRLMDVS